MRVGVGGKDAVRERGVGGWGVTERQHIIAAPQVTEGEPDRRALASVCPRYRLWQVIWLGEKRGRRCVQGHTLGVFSLMGKWKIVHRANNPVRTFPHHKHTHSLSSVSV